MSILLNRNLAPFGEDVWEAVESEAKDVLSTKLSARKVVDVEAPKGAGFSALNTGEKERVAQLAEEEADGELNILDVYVRKNVPVFEFKVPFKISKDDIEAISRGQKGLKDVDSLHTAAHELATAENMIIYSGAYNGEVDGIFTELEESYEIDSLERLPEAAANMVQMLKSESIDGPYALVMSQENYAKAISLPGYPMSMKLGHILQDGKVVTDQFMGDRIALVSLRGGDYKLHLGVDVSIGFNKAVENEEAYELFLFESLTAEVVTKEACALIKVI